MIITVTPSLRPSMWPNVIENLKRQVRKPEMAILVTHKTDAPTSDWEKGVLACGIKQYQVLHAEDHHKLGDVLGLGFAKAETYMDIGLICTMDDDDFYDELYFVELETFFATHLDAAIIGKQAYRCRWMDNKYPPRLMVPRWHSDTELAAKVAGPTIAVNVAAYRANPNLRHPEADPVADVGITMAAHACGLKVYTTSPDNFFLQRYPEGHGHGWVWDGVE
jgi:hypothetical protein